VVNVTIKGGQNAQKRMLAISNRLKDLTGGFEAIHVDYLDTMMEVFSSEGKPRKWDRLSEPYGSIKSSILPNAKILEVSGRLRDSFGENGSQGQVKEINPLSAKFGSSIPYAIYHQYGTSKMPSRPPIQKSNDNASRWNKIMTKWIREVVRKEFS
jgi:phage gpG-like protein